VRRYRFSYDYSPVTKRSRLVRFQEFGSNGIDAKPPEIFTYENTGVDQALFKRPLIGAINFGALHYGRAEYYSTLQYPDINGDGRNDSCIRDGDYGIICALSQGEGFGQTIHGAELTDATGYNQARYYTTIRYPDINGDGKADICYRNAAGIRCGLSTGSSFAGYFNGPAYSDLAGYDQAQYLRTLQYPDINGDGRSDICIRDSQGIECRLSTGTGFGPSFRGPNWSDAIGFAQPKYYKTINYVDINADGKADICVRNAYGILCHLSQGDTFDTSAIAGPQYSDVLGFDEEIYYSSLRYTDLNRDGKIDICARLSTGIDCYYGTGIGFVPAFTSPVFSDDSGFATQNHVYSLQFIDLNHDGFPEICGRKADGLYCHRGTGMGFEEAYFFPLLSDANGFNQDTKAYVFLDHNADGVLDLCHADTTGISCYLSESIYPDALRTITLSTGGIVRLEYTTTAQEPHGQGMSGWPFRGNPGPERLVKRLITSDGRGNDYPTRYDYEGALIKWGAPDEIQDLGFRKVTETNENTGQYKVTMYYQSVSDGFSGADHIRHAGKIELESEYSRNGELLRTMRNEYFDSDTTIYPGTWLSRIKTQYYQTGSGPRNVKSFLYDEYGNVLYMIDRYDPAELIVTAYEYAVDIPANVLNRKISEKQLWDTSKDDRIVLDRYFVDASGDDKVIKWTKWNYQNHNLVSEEKYLDTQNTFLVTYFGYDNSGRRVSVTSPRGQRAGDPAFTTTIEYDQYYLALPVKITGPTGLVIRNEPDSLGVNVVREIQADRNAWLKKYSRFGELSEIIEPGDDWTKRIVFANLGDARSQYMEVQYRQASGYRFERSYFDGLKRIYREEKTGFVETNQPIVTETEYFDSTEKILRQSLPYSAGQSPKYRTYEYDSAGRVVQLTNPDGSIKRLASGVYSSTMQLENGKLRIIQYDARSRKSQILEQIDSPDFSSWAKTTFIYGYLEQTTINPDGHVLRQKYDTLGRQTAVIENGRTHTYVYDYDGNIAYSIAPNGDANDVRYYYDTPSYANGSGRLTHVEDASGSTEFHYDAKGNLTAWVKTMDGIAFTFQASYDPEKRIQKIRYPDGDEVRYVYYTNGVLHQVLLRHNREESPVVTYTATENPGEFSRLTGNNVRDIGTYDLSTHTPLSLKTILPVSGQEGQIIRNLHYTFDATGNITAITDHLNAANTQFFTYDGLNRLTSAVGPYGSLSYFFSKGGKLLRKTGVQQEFADSTNSQAVTRSGSTVLSYDHNGNLTQRNGDHFRYDAENRMTQAIVGAGQRLDIAYDFSGLRAKKVTANSTTYYLSGIKNYGALYELVKRDGYVDAHTKYIYGIQSDRVAQITRSDSALVGLLDFNRHGVLAYVDTRGLVAMASRATHLVNAGLMHPYLARQTLLVISAALLLVLLVILIKGLIESGHEIRRPVVAYAMPWVVGVFFFTINCSRSTQVANNNRAWADLPGESTAPPLGAGAQPVRGIYFYHPDHLGSASFITDASRNMVTTLQYLPYGELDMQRSSGLDIVRYKYTGQEEDAETGLYNYNARQYNPQTGSFTTQDTLIPGDGERSQGLNRYMYAEGNPVRWNDPTGHFIVEALSVGAVALLVCGARSGCPTAPFWHQYTGLNRRCPDFNCEPTTALDRLAQRHDSVNAQLFIDAFEHLGKSIDANLKNIEADATFIGQFHANTFSGALFLENINRAQKQLADSEWGSVGSWVGAVFLGLFYTVTDIIAGAVGTILFSANIFVNALAIAATHTIQFFKSLFGRDEPPCDARCQQQLQTVMATGPRINIHPGL